MQLSLNCLLKSQGVGVEGNNITFTKLLGCYRFDQLNLTLNYIRYEQ